MDRSYLHCKHSDGNGLAFPCPEIATLASNLTGLAAALAAVVQRVRAIMTGRAGIILELKGSPVQAMLGEAQSPVRPADAILRGKSPFWKQR